MRDHFIYGLVHVEEQRTFYIGRGHGDERKRFLGHRSLARRGRIDYVYREWRRIEAAGGAVELVVRCSGLTEGEAVRAERFTIVSIGLDNLKNVGLNTKSSKKRPISVISKHNGKLVGNFNSINELCRELDLSSGTVLDTLKGKPHWRYEFIAARSESN